MAELLHIMSPAGGAASCGAFIIKRRIMIRELYENAKRGIDTRQNLSRLRQEIKEDAKMNDLFELVEDDMDTMTGFLRSGDAKTRKNAALLMGALDMSDFVKPLVEGYKAEEQLFVRSSYLEALKGYDIEEYLDFFKERVDELKKIEITEDNRKHIGEEMRALTELIVSVEGIARHEFTGFRTLPEPVECILMTNRMNMQATQNQLENKDIELIPFKGGVRLKTRSLGLVRDIRTYSDILFVIPDYKTCEFEPIQAARTLAKSKLMELLSMLHKKKDAPFYFRMELKSRLDMEKKSRFAKRCAAELERLSERQLINSTSDYEIELRLIENKDGMLNALLKLYTIKDERFSYFGEHVAASIKPVNAAIIVELAKEYMAPDAQVLDPFCGVGTMLIERQKVVKANTSYGLDINKTAIDAAVKNTKAAGQIVHYVNRNFFTFEHEYLFDEIFTDMPFAMNEAGQEEIEKIYGRFFVSAQKLLKKSGRIIMFSRNPEYAGRYAENAHYRLIKHFPMSEKNDSGVLVFEC